MNLCMFSILRDHSNSRRRSRRRQVEQGAKEIVGVLVGGDLVGVDLSDSVGDWVSNSKTKAVTI